MTSLPSSNWLALQKATASSGHMSKRKIERTGSNEPPTKRLKADTATATNDEVSFPRGNAVRTTKEFSEAIDVSIGEPSGSGSGKGKGKESADHLRAMVKGQLEYSDAQKEPGRYLAIDCEMVGVGVVGAEESSLARVSIVNYHGAVILDEFVRQRERVVDYRTFVSGIRPKDMINAKPFGEVQQRVAELLKDRVVIGHAISNDLKALLLSHNHKLVRDTQQLAGKHKLLGKSPRPALRKLIAQELGMHIQQGEHSSVTDARATIALYRLHRKTWDADWKPPAHILIVDKTPTTAQNMEAHQDPEPKDALGSSRSHGPKARKRRRRQNQAEFPGGGRKGVSSGLSTVVKAAHRPIKKAQEAGGFTRAKGTDVQVEHKWWTTLGSGSTSLDSGGSALKKR